MNRDVSGIFLVSGTSIGAGVLALPIVTGGTGFFPSLLTFFIGWVVMYFTSLMMLEVSLNMPKDINLISMVSQSLGGKWVTVVWFIYLLLFYALLTAYLAMGGEIAMPFSGLSSQPQWLSTLLFLMIFAITISLGDSAVDKVNRCFVVLLLLAYSALIIYLPAQIQPNNLAYNDWSLFIFTFPIIILSFGFHIIIPSLNRYLQYEKRVIQRCLLIGSAIPLIAYVFWQFLILGIVRATGTDGLVHARLADVQITTLLQ